MTLHEDYTRIKVNEVIEAGIKSQEVHRSLSKNKNANPSLGNTMKHKLLVIMELLILMIATVITVSYIAG